MTVRDLISAIHESRIFIQCSELAKHYKKPLLLVQGDFAELVEIHENVEVKDVKNLWNACHNDA